MKKYPCKDCDISYTWKSGLEVHRRNFHSGPHKCNLCTYTFHNEGSLIDHMRNLHDNFVSINDEDLIISICSKKRKANVTEICTPKKIKMEYKCKVYNKSLEIIRICGHTWILMKMCRQSKLLYLSILNTYE